MSFRRSLLTAISLLALSLAACGGDDAAAPDAPAGDDDAPLPDAGVPDATQPDAMPMDEVVQCPAPLPAPTEGSCDVATGTGTAVVVRGNVLAEYTTYVDGSAMYDGDQLVCVGCDCTGTAGYDTATVVTCAGAAVSPGLINAHSHLNYENAAPLASTAPGGTRYQHRHDWRGGVPTPSNQYGTSATSNGMRWNEFRHLFSGTTSIAASTKANALVRNLDELETRDTAEGFERVDYEVFLLGDGNETFHPNCTWNYANTEYGVSLLPAMVTHTAEGINDYAHEEMRCQESSFDGARDFVEHNVGHIHGVGATASDYYNMVRDHSSLVWSPRSNVSLYGNTAAGQIVGELGGNIALGTDWTYSGSANLVREMACVDELNKHWLGDTFSDADIWRMATIGGARATGTDALIGSLEPGKLADLAVFRAPAGVTHRAVIEANTDDVLLVVESGRPMFGEADVIAALDGSCETLDVCGEARRVCASRELGGTTYASIAAAVPAAYPAVFCDVPADEPTCLPSRPGEYAGATVDDPDGDGVTTGDNCPDVFNPIRPMDHGVQADVDGDGIGDACDPTPVGDDLDGDGTPNATDACPFVDDNQTDSDSDGKGDACDACPQMPNPSSVCAPSAASIVDIQNGTIPTGSDVSVEGAVVTGVTSNGFAMQDPTVASGMYAGVWVYTGGAPGVVLGDRVTVAGSVSEYFMNTEINGQVLSKTAGAPLDPIPLTVAQAATEPYENVLVTLTDVVKVDYPYACSADDPACADANLFELNDAIVGWISVWQDGTAAWTSEVTAAAATMTPTVSGVTFYRYNRWRIMPRQGADITP